MSPAAIHGDLAAVLADWNAGKPIRSIYLGHTQRHAEHEEGRAPRINVDTLPFRNRQQVAHAWAFKLIEHFAEALPESFEEFSTVCDELELGAEVKLTREELDGAESLAWKALMLGWAIAIDGMPATRYVNVSRQAPLAGDVGGAQVQNT